MDPNSPQVGTRVGPFLLMERIDADRGALLFRAMRPDSSREPRVVAVRIAENPRDERQNARIRHEYAVLRAIDDVRVPKAIGFYGGPCAIAMTWTEGATLADILTLQREGKLTLDPATALDILAEVAQALRTAHAVPGPRGGALLHSWLGAGRVLLTPRGEVMVMGFGVVPPGTHAGYTPPEQAAGAFVDARSDQWSLGALGVELITGERLYTGSFDRKSDALNGRVQPWVDKVERICPPAARVFAQMLAPAAGERFPREADLVRSLMEIARVEGRPDRLGVASHAWARLRPAPAGADDTEAPTQVAAAVEAPTVRVVEVSAPAPRPLPVSPLRAPPPPPPPDPSDTYDPSPTGFFPRPILPLESPTFPVKPSNPTLVPEDTDSNLGIIATDEEEDEALEPPPRRLPAEQEVTQQEDLPVMVPAPPAPEAPVRVVAPARPAPAPAPPPTEVRATPVDPEDGPSIPNFLPSEYVGMAMGSLLILVGMVFLFWRFG